MNLKIIIVYLKITVFNILLQSLHSSALQASKIMAFFVKATVFPFLSFSQPLMGNGDTRAKQFYNTRQ